MALKAKKARTRNDKLKAMIEFLPQRLNRYMPPINAFLQ